ncbi:MAG: S9 family peptidase [Alphaproteobacteria bacterium]|nr:S9 family peptidase [Alphaproteobacteria bacterium]
MGERRSRRAAGAWGVAAAALAAATAAGAVQAAPSLTRFEDVSLSPDGARVAAIEQVRALTGTPTTPHGQVVIRNAKTGAEIARFDPCAACAYTGFSWSADGRRLAFIASAHNPAQATLEVAQDGKLTEVARIDGVAQSPRFSPDGTLIALMATPGAHKQTGAVEAGAEQVGDIDALQTADEKRIGVVAASGGEVRYVSPADHFVYEYDWRPDGKGFVATAAKGNGDDNWWIAKLIAVDLDTGATRVIATPNMQMNMPHVSPDGRQVVFIGGLMSDFGPSGGDLYAVPMEGGAPVDLSPGVKATYTSLAGFRDGRLAAVRLMGDESQAVLVNLRTGVADVLVSAPKTLSADQGVDAFPTGGNVSFSADGRVIAAEVQDFEHAPELYVGAGGAFDAITRINADLPSQTHAQSVTWTNDGLTVQGWLLKPLDVAPGTHPLIMHVHGGPSSAVTPTYITSDVEGLFPFAEWLKKGYFIFFPNPRGSYGQGEAFTRANIRDFGGGDLRDDLAGIDKVETLAPIDDKRLGVLGHSYGGLTTMWTVTHSHRFAAAIAGAGISNWISYYGENGIDKWMIPFFGASAYDDPAIYVKLSPLTTIKDAKTPTFIYVGERDVECPAPQSFEFWHALKAMGVPTKLVVYAGQGHAIRDPADLADLRQRQIDWFDHYLGTGS